MGTIDGMKEWFTGSPGGGSKSASGELTAHSTIGLTSLGGSKVDSGSLTGQYYEIAATLKDEGASSLAEVSQATRIPVYKVKFLAKTMIKRGYLRKVGADGE